MTESAAKQQLLPYSHNSNSYGHIGGNGRRYNVNGCSRGDGNNSNVVASGDNIVMLTSAAWLQIKDGLRLQQQLG
jgi:hypothetical protein